MKILILILIFASVQAEPDCVDVDATEKERKLFRSINKLKKIDYSDATYCPALKSYVSFLRANLAAANEEQPVGAAPTGNNPVVMSRSRGLAIDPSELSLEGVNTDNQAPNEQQELLKAQQSQPKLEEDFMKLLQQASAAQESAAPQDS